jgi:short-subunit dehydrogenase
MLNVQNRWCLITGASRGVGREIAKQMASLGTNLILQSRSRKHSEETAAIVREMGVQALSVECDLEDPKSVASMLTEIDSTSLKVDLVFNNAGLMSHYFVDYTKNTLEDFHQAMAVNFFAPIQIAYHFLPKMIQNGFGRMQLTTSGIANEPELAAYACAKAALTKFVKDFACKLNGSDVMMNVMDPGWLRTDLGGPKAPNAVESVVPGALVGVLLEDKKSGRWFSAQNYVGLDLETAVKKAESVEF